MPVIVIIAFAVLAALGLVSIFAPTLVMRADKRNDPDAIAQMKKGGKAILGFLILALVLLLKYEVF